MLVKQKKVKYDLLIEVIRVKHKKGISLGFTLVELLVVVGILTVLLAITLIAINPFEQINKTTDVSTRATIKDFASATKYFYTEEKTTPWVKNSTCRDELSTQNTISQMPSCVQELTKGGDLQTQAINSSEAKDIFMTECSNSIALCYKPKSSTYKNNSQAKFQRNGASNPKCPDDENCYICEFTTNEAAECFEIMSPNTDLIAAASSNNQNEPMPVVERPSVKVCGDPDITETACMSDVVTDSAGNQLTTLALPNGLSPEKIHKAYNLPCKPGGPVDWQCETPTTFGPETIAIIGAFHNPSIESDLAVYSNTYGIPPCTQANGCLTIVNQNGQTSPLPTGRSSGWEYEASLDVQSAHATCQTCKILLVETDSNSWVNMGTGTQTAANMGATVVSNSYGNTEVNNFHSQFDHFYENHPGVALTASSGDWGHGSLYPAAHKNVVGIGGTELYLFPDNTYASERVWGGAGSGCALNQNAGPHQTSLPNWSAVGCGTKKAISDVSAVAAPQTGAAIYVGGRWMIFGGTSLSSPIYAGVIALQGGIPAGSDGAAFPYTQKDKYRDILVGSNGGCGGTSICRAGEGYDGPTGLGTPNLLPQGGVTPTVFPNPTPTPTPTITPTPDPNIPTPTPTKIPTPTPTPKDIISSLDPAYAYAVDTYHHLVTKVSRLGTSLGNICLEGEKLYCYGSFILSPSDKTSNYCQDYIGNSIPVYTQVGCSSNFTQTPWPTPTPAYPNCSQQHTISLKDNAPILATPGSKVTTTVVLKNNNTGVCKPIEYIINYTYPGNINPDTWLVTGPTGRFGPSGPFLLGTGETKELAYTIHVPSVGLSNKDYVANFSAGTYLSSEYTSWWVKAVGWLNAIVRVTGAPPTVTPTPNIPAECITQPTVTLSEPLTLGLPGTKIKSKMTIKRNASPTCDPVFYTVSYSIPTGWGLLQRGMYRALLPNVTDIIDYTLYLPSDGLFAQDYNYQFWITTAGQPSVDPIIVNGTTRVLLPGSTISPLPSPTPTPPANCDTMQTVTLAQPIISAIPGATVTNTLTVKNNNTGNCNSVFYTISRGYPLGWVQNGIPNSFTLTTGETKNIEFSMVLSTSGLLVQDYIYQFWVAKQGQTVVENPANGIVRVTQASPTNPPTPTPTPTQIPTPTPTLPVQPTNPPINYDTIVPGYHIDQSKFFKTYAVYFFDHPGFAPSGAGWNMQISTRSDFTASYPDQLTSYGIPSSYGQDAPLNDSYAALRNITNKYVGFTSIIPYDYNQNHCGQTIYWRITNFYNPSATDKKYGPTYTGVIDCTTKVGMVDPPLSWYAVFDYGTYKQKYYEPLWDYDKNGVINWTDYWLGAFSTKFRSGGWQPPE